MSVNSASYVLPITNNITINIQSGNVTINQDAALLAGVEVNIAEGAGLTVANGKNIYFYDSDEWNSDNFVWGTCKFKSVAYAPGKAYNRSNNDLVDAKMDVNGSVTAIGAIYTTKGGADICSSKGTGKYIQQETPGAETATYQYNANGKSKEIPITAAKLKNADGKYTETANASAGKTIPYCTCPTCVGNGGGKWLKDFAAIIDSTTGNQLTTHNTLQDAVENLKAGQYIKMLHSTTGDVITEDVTTGNVTTNNKDLYLDLNGCTVTGAISVMGTHKLYGMDSATDEYDGTSAGKIDGKVTGTVAPVFETKLKANEDHRYVSIQSGNSYSFHRFNISVTGYRFELAAPQCALFFIGKFQGDDAAKGYLTSLGFTLKVKGENGENDTQLGEDNYELPDNKNEIPKMPAAGEESTSKVVYDRDGDGAYLFEVYLKRSFKKGESKGYTEYISATAQATFKNGRTQQSDPRELSFQEAWTDKGLTTGQREILDKFLTDLGIK